MNTGKLYSAKNVFYCSDESNDFRIRIVQEDILVLIGTVGEMITIGDNDQFQFTFLTSKGFMCKSPYFSKDVFNYYLREINDS